MALILDCDGLARQAGLRLEIEAAPEPAPVTADEVSRGVVSADETTPAEQVEFA